MIGSPGIIVTGSRGQIFSSLAFSPRRQKSTTWMRVFVAQQGNGLEATLDIDPFLFDRFLQMM